MRSPAPGSRGRGYDTAAIRSALLAGYSLDMTGELGELEQASAVIPPGTRIHAGVTDGQDLASRVSTAQAVERAGFVPVPVIAARRLRSKAMLREYLDRLQAAGVSGSVLAVAGDPALRPPPHPAGSSGRWRPAMTRGSTAR